MAVTTWENINATDLPVTATWAPGSAPSNLTFSAPDSGMVLVTSSSFPAHGQQTWAGCSSEVRVTNSSGAIVLAASDYWMNLIRPAAVAPATDWNMGFGGCSRLLTGLTPGATYYAQTMLRGGATTGNTIYQTSILVEAIIPASPPVSSQFLGPGNYVPTTQAIWNDTGLNYSFVAPTGGVVVLDTYCILDSDQTATSGSTGRIIVAYEIHAGSLAGTIVVTNNTWTQMAVQGEYNGHGASIRRMHSGLTPGTSYFVKFLCYFDLLAGGDPDVWSLRQTVEFRPT